MKISLCSQQIETAIKKFNTKKKSLWMGDHATHLVFQYKLQRRAWIPVQILVINYIWKTNVDKERKEGKALVGIYDKIIGEYSDLKKYTNSINKIQTISSQRKLERVFQLIDRAFPLLLKSTSHNHVSFVTKFLHWHCPKVLPIWDKRARQKIRKCQKKWKWCANLILSNEAQVNKLLSRDAKIKWFCNEYKKMILFYHCLTEHFGLAEQRRLVNLDFGHQKRIGNLFAHKNTFVRILDKYFYVG